MWDGIPVGQGLSLASDRSCRPKGPPYGKELLERNSQILGYRIYASSGTSPGRGGPFGAVISFVGSASPPTGHGRRDACPTFKVLYPISTKFCRYRFPKGLFSYNAFREESQKVCCNRYFSPILFLASICITVYSNFEKELLAISPNSAKALSRSGSRR